MGSDSSSVFARSFLGLPEQPQSTTCSTSNVPRFALPVLSDIIIEHHGIKIHAHRAILRMCSPFFERILRSQWPVAKGPVFSLGDEDDPIVVDGMLRHILHVKTFFLADKYDCPSLRRAAVSNFHGAAMEALGSSTPILLINTIATLCGPDARPSADSSLRTAALNFCATNYNKLFESAMFRKLLREGYLFDLDATTKLLDKIGSLALKKQAISRHRFGLPSRDESAFPRPEFRDLDSSDSDDLDNLRELSLRERDDEGCRSS